MTQITDPQLDAVRRALEADAAHAPLNQQELSISYLRRIHWWVRLFGIIWIVIPAIVGTLAIFFLFLAAVIGWTR